MFIGAAQCGWAIRWQAQACNAKRGSLCTVYLNGCISNFCREKGTRTGVLLLYPAIALCVDDWIFITVLISFFLLVQLPSNLLCRFLPCWTATRMAWCPTPMSLCTWSSRSTPLPHAVCAADDNVITAIYFTWRFFSLSQLLKPCRGVYLAPLQMASQDLFHVAVKQSLQAYQTRKSAHNTCCGAWATVDL